MGSIRVIRDADIPKISTGASTEKWTRRVTDLDELVTVNQVRNAPEASSGWHHHGENTGYVCVLEGRLRIEWGAGGRESADLTAGDIYVIPPNTVHCEANPGSADQVVIAFIVGSGRKFINVDGPDPE